jgi:hypothetical protein
MWARAPTFGIERIANPVLIEQLLGDRMLLTLGMHVLRDEIEIAAPDEAFAQPLVVTTVAFTNCGDRVHQAEIAKYRQVIASRFATLSQAGELKPEAFYPPGGGTDDGKTLAQVTVSHELDEPLRERIYRGNPQSYVLAAFDLKSHVGRDDSEGKPVFGRVRESIGREPRAACGAIVGTLGHFDDTNLVHQRIRRDLGPENYELLRVRGVKTEEGIDITAVVAAAIIVVRGIENTARALTAELDERGLGHLTGSITINRTDPDDTLIYLHRATVFGGTIRHQGFGLDASKYGGRLVRFKDEMRLQLTYDGRIDGFAIEEQHCAIPEKKPRSAELAYG